MSALTPPSSVDFRYDAERQLGFFVIETSGSKSTNEALQREDGSLPIQEPSPELSRRLDLDPSFKGVIVSVVFKKPSSSMGDNGRDVDGTYARIQQAASRAFGQNIPKSLHMPTGLTEAYRGNPRDFASAAQLVPDLGPRPSPSSLSVLSFGQPLAQPTPPTSLGFDYRNKNNAFFVLNTRTPEALLPIYQRAGLICQATRDAVLVKIEKLDPSGLDIGQTYEAIIKTTWEAFRKSVTNEEELYSLVESVFLALDKEFEHSASAWGQLRGDLSALDPKFPRAFENIKGFLQTIDPSTFYEAYEAKERGDRELPQHTRRQPSHRSPTSPLSRQDRQQPPSSTRREVDPLSLPGSLNLPPPVPRSTLSSSLDRSTVQVESDSLVSSSQVAAPPLYINFRLDRQQQRGCFLIQTDTPEPTIPHFTGSGFEVRKPTQRDIGVLKIPPSFKGILVFMQKDADPQTAYSVIQSIAGDKFGRPIEEHASFKMIAQSWLPSRPQPSLQQLDSDLQVHTVTQRLEEEERLRREEEIQKKRAAEQEAFALQTESFRELRRLVESGRPAQDCLDAMKRLSKETKDLAYALLCKLPDDGSIVRTGDVRKDGISLFISNPQLLVRQVADRSQQRSILDHMAQSMGLEEAPRVVLQQRSPASREAPLSQQGQIFMELRDLIERRRPVEECFAPFKKLNAANKEFAYTLLCMFAHSQRRRDLTGNAKTDGIKLFLENPQYLTAKVNAYSKNCSILDHLQATIT